MYADKPMQYIHTHTEKAAALVNGLMFRLLAGQKWHYFSSCSDKTSDTFFDISFLANTSTMFFFFYRKVEKW